MFKWVAKQLIWLLVSIVLLAVVVYVFFAVGGPAFISSVMDGIVSVTGGIRG